MLRLLALLCALALAGCLGGEAPAAAAPAAEPTALADAPEAPENATIGPPAPVEEAVAHAGAMSDFARVCPGVADCVGTAATRPYSGWIQQTPGAATAYRAELAWSAASPLTQEIGFMALVCAEDADGARRCEPLAVVEGASPLALQSDGLTITPGALLYLHPYMPSRAPIPGYAELRQDFTIEGVVLVQPTA